MVIEHELDFARRHKEIRELRGLTQRQEADKLGIVANVVSNWEMGIAIPRTKMIPKICIALNCTPGELLGLSPTVMTSDEYTLLKGYRDLDDAGKHTMLALLESQLQIRNRSDG